MTGVILYRQYPKESDRNGIKYSIIKEKAGFITSLCNQ